MRRGGHLSTGGHFGSLCLLSDTRHPSREATMCRLINLPALALCPTTLVSNQLNARDDGRFANSPLKPWFDRLASGNGLCCSFADGFSVQDVDWGTPAGHYRVRIYGQWLVVPDAAVVTEPNRFGSAFHCSSRDVHFGSEADIL